MKLKDNLIAFFILCDYLIDYNYSIRVYRTNLANFSRHWQQNQPVPIYINKYHFNRLERARWCSSPVIDHDHHVWRLNLVMTAKPNQKRNAFVRVLECSEQKCALEIAHIYNLYCWNAENDRRVTITTTTMCRAQRCHRSATHVGFNK